MTRGPCAWLALLAAGAAWMAAPARAVAPRFFPDDPIAVDPEHLDAGGVTARPHNPAADVLGMISGRGGAGLRAVNLNTVDEVPDSSWFTNRIGAGRRLSVEEVARGPLRDAGPAEGPWTIVHGESGGVPPRLTARDAAGTIYALWFDPVSHPELATGADAVAMRLIHALGYHTAQNHLTRVRREDLMIAGDAAIRDGTGRRRMMRGVDLDILLSHAARAADGRYRAIASREADGSDLGQFAFSGVRRDDPNDIFPHQHRRELRGLRVVSAWLNHDDARSFDTRDVLEHDGHRRIVRHYLIDFGSMLGAGSVRAGSPLAGNEDVWSNRSKIMTALTFGLWVRPWHKVEYPDLASVGRFEAASFAPDAWRPRYRNAAFDRARPDDDFWAARRVVAIDDEAIRASVRAAQYSDPHAETYVIRTLTARRDAIGRVWLNAVLPLADCELTGAGVLACSNVAVDAGLATPADEYRIRWHRFDNQTDEAQPFGGESAAVEPRFTAPAELLETSEFVMAEIRARHARHPAWASPVTIHLRRIAGGWRTVGLERAFPSLTAVR